MFDVRKKLPKGGKIAICHPQLRRGGSEARVMWAIEALKNEYQVTLVTGGPVELAQLNEYYNTVVTADDIFVLQAPMPAFLQKRENMAALKGAYYHRFCKSIASTFHVMISAYNPVDFGVPAIHFVADFSWDDEIRNQRDLRPGLRQLIHRNGILRHSYLMLTKWIAPPSGRNLYSGQDRIIANSQWSANIINHKYGAQVDVLYPPVFAKFPLVDEKNKSRGFVCIGRISPEKKIEHIIEILQKVRAGGHNVHLHVIGAIDSSDYGQKIARLCQKSWIFVDGLQYGEKKAKLLSSHRFGIQARPGEPFGISVAEMAQAGCVTFCHEEGGQAEIVNHHALLFKDIDDAVTKIKAVLCDSSLEKQLRRHLQLRGKKFSTAEFVYGLRSAVNNFASTNIIQPSI